MGISGNLFNMNSFVGHIQAKIDTKGRLLFPAAFKKTLSPQSNESFVVKKDIFENCLVIYPSNVWQEMVEKLQNSLNPYNQQHNMFLRMFFLDTAYITLDNNNRLLIPKRLLSLGSIKHDVILLGVGNKIELWDPTLLKQSLTGNKQYIELAEKIFNGNL